MTTQYAYSVFTSTRYAYSVHIPCGRLLAMSLQPSKPLKKPARLTADERTRLERYEDTPGEQKSEAELLDELDLHARAEAWHKYCGVAVIRRLLPADAEVRRGLLTDVTDASPYKREYVSRIRDGIAANYND